MSTEQTTVVYTATGYEIAPETRVKDELEYDRPLGVFSSEESAWTAVAEDCADELGRLEDYAEEEEVPEDGRLDWAIEALEDEDQRQRWVIIAWDIDGIPGEGQPVDQ